MTSMICVFACMLAAAPLQQRVVLTGDASGPVTADRPQPASPDQQGTQPATDRPEGDMPPTPAHTGSPAMLVGLGGDIKRLPSVHNLYLAGIGGALAFGAHPFDKTVNARLISHYNLVNNVFKPAKYYGDTPEQLAFSIGTWAIGRLADKPKMAHLGMDLLRAQAVTEMLVEPIKFATHRERPDGSNFQSFPSGHAAVTFATAAVIERHLGWRRSLIAYGIATYVAASRLHDNRHYLSDVVFGATVGSIAGRTVTRHGRDTWTLMPITVDGGVALAVTRSGF